MHSPAKLLASAFVALLATSMSITSAQAQTRIVGGTDATPGDHPWMAAIVDASTNNTFQAQFCGGSLIAKNWVLTAAHCVFGSESTPMDVVIGTSELGDGSGERIGVQSVHVHPKYNDRGTSYDYALLQLKGNSSITPVELLMPGDKSASAGKTATVIGWGLTTDGGTRAEKLQQVSVPILSVAACESAYPGSITKNVEMCAGLKQGGKDSCQGDSGGPLFVKGQDGNQFVQAGVVSWGNGCALAGNPGVYARVDGAASWIDETMKNPGSGGSSSGGSSSGGSSSGGSSSGGSSGGVLAAVFTSNCNGLRCTFDAKGSTAGDAPIDDYIWEVGRNKWKYGRRIKHTFKKAGTYPIILFVLDEDGEAEYQEKNITVKGNSGAGASPLVKQQWYGRVRENGRTLVPGRQGFTVSKGRMNVVMHHGRKKNFNLKLQKLNETTNRWQTLEHAATGGTKEVIRLKSAQAGQYRFSVISRTGRGRFRVTARHP